ncbi:MAG: hypothetical protein CL772_00165 [Chloroflexi bacterium]|nr:hypothetical protein [Chloroflexota bacterium]|tara:strand:- start:25693 stop:27216 length:1524 start_codon:yes stop_codon:yes gene_type:complete
MFKFKLQTQITISFLLIISLSFIFSYVATDTIWQRNIQERNEEYRSKVSKSISDSLATYYQSWGSFEQGFENVLVREMTNLDLDPNEDSIGVVDENYEWIIASPNAIKINSMNLQQMISDEKYIISSIDVNFSNKAFDSPTDFARQIRRVQESYRLGLLSREDVEKSISLLRQYNNNFAIQVADSDLSNNIKTVGYLVFVNKEINLIEAYENLIIISFFGIFLLSVVVAYFISLQIASPVKKLTFATNKVSKGVFEPIQDINSGYELSDLTNSFNLMVNKMKQIQTQREQLFSDISHELRNPLTVLRVNIEGILEKKIQLNDKKLHQINDQIILLSKLIDDLSLIANAESGELKLNLELLDINNVLQETFNVFEDSAKELNIKFEKIFQNPIKVTADPFRIRQVFSNIFSNALKYLKPENKLEINFDEDDNNFYIKFLDNGPGIPKEKLEFIFDRFYKVDENRDRNLSGSGLGLAITKQLCLAHNWDILVKSKISEGTEFIIIIPKD